MHHCRRMLIGSLLAATPVAAQVPSWTLVRSWPPWANGGASYDEARQRVVWNGAQIATDSWDTWEWNGAAWQFRGRGGGGGAVTGLGQAYDASRRRTVLVGAAAGGTQRTVHEWDGAQWTTLTPASGPAPRYNHGLAYDAARQRVVLFGGSGGAAAYFDDTWTWDGATWTPQPSAARPSPRGSVAMAFDAAHAVVVLFGGQNGNAVGADTWLWNGTAWQQAVPATVPARRGTAGMVWHRTRQRIVMAGGGDASRNPFSDVWEWDGSNWTSSLPALPGPRVMPGLVYDAATDRLLLVAGGGNRSDTWVLNGPAWQLLVPLQAPITGIGDATIAIDAATNRPLYLVSRGQFSSFATFEHDGTRWTELPTTVSPTSGSRMLAATDFARGRTVAVASGGPIASTYEWTGTDWVLAAPSPPVTFPALATDPITQRVLLFGGMNSAGLAATNLWDWNGTAWTQRLPAASPPGRYQHAMATDPLRNRVVLFGGAAPGRLFNDTWLFDGVTWTQAQPATVPMARYGHAMAFDAGRNAVILCGGTDGNATLLGGPWAWNGSDWVAVPSALFQPYNHTIAYDSVRRRLLALVPADEFRPLALFALTDSAPAAAPGGPGCGAPAPRLTGDLPYLGNLASELELAANPNTACLFGVADATQTLALGGGCSLYLSGTIALQFTVTNASGIAHASVPVPFTPALRGLVAHAQAAALDPSGPLGGVALSNGWRLVVAD